MSRTLFLSLEALLSGLALNNGAVMAIELRSQQLRDTKFAIALFVGTVAPLAMAGSLAKHQRSLKAGH